jgi:hypothetical protein
MPPIMKKAMPFPLLPLTLAYLALPLLIFFCGWLKPVYAVLASASVIYGGWRLIKDWPAETCAFQLGEILVVTTASLALTAFVGIGDFVFQDFDWIKHNAVLFDCINVSWPVFLADDTGKWPLVYYLAYYLPAALVGKLFGYQTAQVALWIWSAMGVLLATLWFARLARLWGGIAFMAFFAFSGMDVLVNLHLVPGSGGSGTHAMLKYIPDQDWSYIWQFPSNYWALEWSPGQALSAWLCAAAFLGSPAPMRTAVLSFVFVCAIFWSLFTALGLLLVAGLLFLKERPLVSGTLVRCLIALSFPFLVLFAFFAGKNSTELSAQFGTIPFGWFYDFRLAPASPWLSVQFGLLFVVLEFGTLVLLLRYRFAKGTFERSLVDSSGLVLLLLMPVTLGFFNDLALRACAPPMFCLAVLTARAVFAREFSAPKYWMLCVVVLIGTLTPLLEACSHGRVVLQGNHNLFTVPHRVSAILNMTQAEGLLTQYVGSTNSFFVHYLIRQ